MKRLLLSLTGFLFFQLVVPAMAEDVKITTSYPSPYGVYKQVRAGKYCDESGALCGTLSQVSNQVYYFPRRQYPGGSWMYSEFLENAKTANGSTRSLTTTSTITKAELTSFYPQIAAETRDITGIIVDYWIGTYNNATASGHGWYYVTIRNADGPAKLNNDIEYAESQTFYYTENASNRTPPAHGSNFVVMDFNNDDQFSVITELYTQDLGGLPNNQWIYGRWFVVGYITG